jgi:hypothetical protein
MDEPAQAQEEWPDVMKTVYNSLYQGDNAYMHCMAGVHRAGLGGVMSRAVLHGEAFSQAREKVRAVRQIQPERVVEDFGPRRIEEMLKIRVTPPGQRPAGWAEFRALMHAMAEGEGGTSMPLCGWSQKEERAAAKLRAEVEISGDIEG